MALEIDGLISGYEGREGGESDCTQDVVMAWLIARWSPVSLASRLCLNSIHPSHDHWKVVAKVARAMRGLKSDVKGRGGHPASLEDWLAADK